MSAPKVLFIGWDAADWKAIHPLMDAGRMPHLQRLVENGASGRVATLNPPLSPMLWTSIATGKRAFKHGIHGFSEPTPDGRGVRPVSNLSRTAKTVWNILNQNGLRSVVIGWWPSHPVEPINGVMVSDHYHRAHRPLDQGWPLLPNAVWPPELHEPLAELRLHPQELVGPMLLPFVPALEKVDQKKDRRFSMLCKIIAECASIHSAATWLMENQAWDFFAVYYDAIDHFCHGFMRYHPPRQPWIGEEEFELYSNVVSTAYELHDRMLGTLLAKAGDDVRVILMSDHGFHPDHLRPRAIPEIPAGPAIEHSNFGIFAMSGPGIKRDESLFGVSVLDATPTLLTLFGLPVGRDMDGRVVTAAFDDPPEIREIPSWEDVPGEDGRHPPHTRLDPMAATEALEQLAALGYIEKPGEDVAQNVEKAVRELRYNLLEACQDANRHPEAVEIARDLCRRDPNEQRFAVKRFHSCQALGLVTEMREIVDDLKGRRKRLFEEAAEQTRKFRELARERIEQKGETRPDEIEKEIALELNPNLEPDEPREFLLAPEERREMLNWRGLLRYQPGAVDYLEAQTLTAEKRWFEALEALSKVSARQMARPGVLLQAADLYRRLGRPAEAEKTYSAALQIDPDNVHAHLGLCRLALRRREYENAAAMARECVGRLYFFPMAHLMLGIARSGLGDTAAAAEEFRLALSQNPHFPQAHLWLGRLLRSKLGDPATAEIHFQFYREMRKRRARPLPGQAPPGPESAEGSENMPLEEPLPPLGNEVLVVSGLPRSGTSMVMQMLAAGGTAILADEERKADEDNPNGYFEYEAVKKMLRDASWIDQSRGKAVKIVAPLVGSIPSGPRYRVILMERDLTEILASQAKMIERRREAIADSPQRHERLMHEYRRIMERTKRLMRGRDDVRMLVLRHSEVIRDPRRAARKLAEFAGGGLNLDRMAAAVDASLHRNRAGTM